MLPILGAYQLFIVLFYNFYTDIIAGECEDKQAGDAGMELAGTRT